jgi:hypothetical protein
MPSVFTLSGSGRRRKRRRGGGLAGGVFRSCPREPISLRRVRLDRGGYDENGRYFGVGQPLFIADADTEWEFLRARDRDDAKRKLRISCPGIRFKR